MIPTLKLQGSSGVLQVQLTIERLVEGKAEEGFSLLSHERRMSAFRFVRWNPPDNGLSNCVQLLASRGDDQARNACRRYLTELPWGQDRQATFALLDGILASGRADSYALLKEALAIHRQPVVLRILLWDAIGELDPGECLHGAIRDFEETTDDADRTMLIDYVGGAVEDARSRFPDVDLQSIAVAAENVDTADWSPIVRGYYGTVLKLYLPEAKANRVSNSVERALISVARAWEVARSDRMGRLIPLACRFGLAYLVTFGFDHLVGEPQRVRLLPPLCL